MSCISNLPNAGDFSRSDLLGALKKESPGATSAQSRFVLQRLLDSGQIVRIGRNRYSVIERSMRLYNYKYSALACELAGKIQASYPSLDFRILELLQLNEFVNHQLAHNILLVSVESDLGSYVFEALRGDYPGKVLFHPSPADMQRYWAEDMIVIEKLTTEAPKGRGLLWHTELEKLLVDLVADKLLAALLDRGEYRSIFAQAFQSYYLDESQLGRYARRRNAGKKIAEYLDKKLMRTV